MQELSKKTLGLIIILVIFGAFFTGVKVGANSIPAIEKVSLANKETQVETTADFAPFWKVWNSINEKYPTPSDITDQERIYGAISGLVNSLNDPYSVFFDPDETKSFQEEISGNFTGVGMEVGIKDKILTVIAPIKDTPAYRAGIKSGDKILKIDNTVTTGLKIEDCVKLLKGEKGTKVVLTILHEGAKESEEITIIRDIINLPTLDTELREDGIFVIKLYSFSATSSNLFRDALKEFALSQSDKLILDLRDNPGGYLDAAVSISSWFLPAGKIIATEEYGNNRKSEVFRSRGYGITAKGKEVLGENLKLVVLIDGGSASASEIVAGAMQDHKRAKLVGTKSYGKGSVQETIKVTLNTLLKITVAKWLTPNGVSISEKGLTPDYVVEISKKDTDASKDPQMEKAIELLLKK